MMKGIGEANILQRNLWNFGFVDMANSCVYCSMSDYGRRPPFCKPCHVNEMEIWCMFYT